jgi:outer membrane protein
MRYRMCVLVCCCARLAAGQGGAPVHLSLKDAAALALKNHPQVAAEQNATSAERERIVEVRSAYLPSIYGYGTVSQGNIGGRIGAGQLSVSRLFNRVGTGIEINQLITDSGRTANLLAQSRLQAGAEERTYQATQYDVILGVNQAYFDALRAEGVVKVAEKTLAARKLVAEQVSLLAQNRLRSELDVSFAEVNVAQAQLLLIRSQNMVQSAYAELTRALGSQQPATYRLVDEAMPPSPPAQAEVMVAQGLRDRPELASLRLTRDAAYRFERAERDLKRPTVSLVVVGGYMPYIDQITLPRVIPNEYEGGALNLQIPVFNGNLFTARAREAHYRALEADQKLRDREEGIARDIRTAWANAMTAYEGIDVTARLLREATLALSLAQGRYNLGLANIVELTQAQLNVTEAEIENLSAKYDYQSQYATLQYTIGALR